MQLNINNIIKTACLLCTVVLSGCLKEDYDNGNVQPTHSSDGTPAVIEMPLTATSTENFFLLAVDNSDNDTIVDFIPIKLATATPASGDIHVTVSLNSTLLDDYNTEHGTAYEEPPADVYSFENPEVVIPAGSNTGYLKVKFTPSDFIGHEYAFGLAITNVKESGYTISGNFSSGVAAITIKNKYDGLYHAVGSFEHPNPDFTGTYDKEWTLATAGPTSVSFALDVTVLFAVTIVFDVDQQNNLVALSRVGAALDPYDPSLNYYDPATRTFHYNFSYSGGTRHCVGTATYTGPR